MRSKFTVYDRSTLSDLPGYAKVRADPGGGRSDEFRLGERLRGDRGGGPEGDGNPMVPHAAAEPGRALYDDEIGYESLAIGVEYQLEVAIVEVLERYDEPALEPPPSETELWTEVFEELARRSRQRW